ncbi:MAG: hypothetical protein K0R05_3724 [Anaerocolumna sp.]|nr:hypothetical protein [Anaerocolumna sp.]
MASYHIFSDSSCDTPIELLNLHHITLIPFYVTFDLEHYYKENVEISNEEFYQRLSRDKIFPKTSLPSVMDYCHAFEKEILNGNDILCLCLTQKFSGSYQSAVNARELTLEKYPDSNIQIVDSIQATGGQGILLMQTAYLKEAGYSLADTVKRLEEIKSTARIMFTVDTLEYLAKGGRIGKAASLAGTMLNIKPMIQLRDAEYFSENNARYEDYDFCLANATTAEDTKTVQSQLENLIGRKITYPMFQIGVTIGTYTGPGAVGVCFVRKFDR